MPRGVVWSRYPLVPLPRFPVQDTDTAYWCSLGTRGPPVVTPGLEHGMQSSRPSHDAGAETAAFRAAVPEGVDGLVDAAVLDAAALDIVRDGGALATVRFWSGPTERGIRVHPVKVRDHLHDGAGIARLAELVLAKRLTLRVADTLPAARAADAHRRLEAGGVRGRLVLTF